MHITVKLFALMREKAGTGTVHLEVPEGATIAHVLAVLRRQCPILEPYLAEVRVSLHMEFVPPETILQAGDELAIIPPVSGGA
jgi:molybdopterin converting factor subunit 1